MGLFHKATMIKKKQGNDLAQKVNDEPNETAPSIYNPPVPFP